MDAERRQNREQWNEYWGYHQKWIPSFTTIQLNLETTKCCPCNECSTPSPSNLILQPPNQMLYQCPMCPFAEATALHAHENPNPGSALPTEDTQSSTELYQQNDTNSKPHLYSVCGKSFSRPDSLKIHHRIHTGEKPHKCTYCGKDFRRVETLKLHLRIHTGEKPYGCSLCPIRFVQKQQFADHFKTHTGEKPNKCEFCLKCFTKKSNLKEHLRVHTEPLSSRRRIRSKGNKVMPQKQVNPSR